MSSKLFKGLTLAAILGLVSCSHSPLKLNQIIKQELAKSVDYRTILDSQLTYCYAVDGANVYADHTSCPAAAMIDNAVKRDEELLKPLKGHLTLQGYKLVYTSQPLKVDQILIHGITDFNLQTTVISSYVPPKQFDDLNIFPATKHELMHEFLWQLGEPNELNAEHLPPELFQDAEADNHP